MVCNVMSPLNIQVSLYYLEQEKTGVRFMKISHISDLSMTQLKLEMMVYQ